MPASPTSVVDAAYSLTQAGQGGYELGNSTDAFAAYTNALNLASTFAGQSPFAVGLNAAATANNTTYALSQFQNGTLQPSDILQITGTALSLCVAAAAIAGAPVTIPALVLAGTVGIVAGPGPLRDQFNELARLIGDKMAGGTLGSVPANLPAIAAGAGTPSDGALVVRQYDIGLSELVTFEYIGRDGVSRGQIGQEAGQTTVGYMLPPIKVMVSGTFDDPTFLTQFPTEIDLSTATQVSVGAVAVTAAEAGSFANFANGDLGSIGNSQDFAFGALSAAGYDYGSFGGLFSPGSLSGEYLGYLDWFNHPNGEWYYDQYVDPDMEADWRLNRLHQIENNVGEMDGHDELGERVQMGVGSPIVIDLNGDGIHTIRAEDSAVVFDVTGDGIAERTAWLAPQDAFLVWDKDLNGAVSGVSEMFGGLERGVGFSELSELDANADGVLNSADMLFSSLQLWTDGNSNGISDAGEMRSLADGNVESIQLAFRSQETRDNGNLLGEVSQAMVNGASTEVADVYFRYYRNSSSPINSSSITNSTQVAGAPSPTSASAGSLNGMTHSLISAMAGLSTVTEGSETPGYESRLSASLAMGANLYGINQT